MKIRISSVVLLVSSMVAASAGFAPGSRGPVHIHYIISTDSAGRYTVREANACDVARMLSDDLKRMKSSDRDLTMHVNMLHGMACEPVVRR
jgi:hypothetical protein